MTSRRIALGIIGTGIAARNLHWPAIQRMGDLFEIVALCNRTKEKAEAFAELVGGQPRITDDYQELLSWQDVEAVDVALPIALNAPVTVDALRAGKHVILEKPIAADVDAAQAIVDEGERHPELVLLVAENLRYENRLREARRLLDGGRIGQPIMFHSDVLQPVDPSSPYAGTGWRQRPEHLGGYLSDGGVHHTAALHVLAGPVSAVQGSITSFHPEQGPDTLLANLRFASGAVGHLTYSVGVPNKEPAPLRVYGTSGWLHIHDDRIVLSSSGQEESIPVARQPNGYYREFADFHGAIAERKPPLVGAQEGMDDLLVIDAILRSHQEGKLVHLR